MMRLSQYLKNFLRGKQKKKLDAKKSWNAELRVKQLLRITRSSLIFFHFEN